MSAEQNMATERRFVEVWRSGELAVNDEVFAPDVVLHGFAMPAPGVDGVKQVMAAFRAGFPDCRMDEHDMLAVEDKVLIRWTLRGTHRGEYLGAAPTGKSVAATGMHLDRFADGRIVERSNAGSSGTCLASYSRSD
jgi:steroid delta-isomerase-like uncharacterized protein